MNAISNIAATATGLSLLVDRKGLVDALKLAKLVTERRNTIPILSTVLFVATVDKLTLHATDLDMQITTELPVATEGLGAVAIDMATILATVSKFKGETVKLEALAGKVAVCNVETGARVTLQAMKPDDFPMIASGDLPTEFELAAETLRDALGDVAGSMSTEETRYYLQGAFMHVRHTGAMPPRFVEHDVCANEIAALGKLDQADVEAWPHNWREFGDEVTEADAARSVAMFARAVRHGELSKRCAELEAERMAPNTLSFASTDGHRLTRVSLPMPVGAESLPDAIVPRKAVGFIGKLIGKKAAFATARLQLSTTKAVVTYGRVRMITKLIDGTFPDYTRVIPSNAPHRLEIPAAALAEAVESVSSIACEKTRAVALSVIAGEPVAVSCTSPENGRSAQCVDVDSIDEGAHLAIGFNAAYLQAGLKLFGDSSVILGLCDATAPTLFTSASRPDLEFILMPMRVDATPMTRVDVDAMHMTPVQKLGVLAGQYRETLAALDNPDAMERGLATLARATLGVAMKAAIAQIVEDSRASRADARLTVKALVAAHAGDTPAAERAMLLQHAMRGGVARSYGAIGYASDPDATVAVAEPEAAPEAPAAEPELPSQADEERESETPESEWVENPNYPDVPENDPMRPAAVEPEPVDASPAQDPAPVELDPADAGSEPEPVKVEDVYGRVYFVLAADFYSDKVFVHRVHKDGAPFCERESKGGAWQRILRDNIKRQILPRGSVDRPAKAAQAAPAAASAPIEPSALESRLAELERIVAGISAGQPVAVPAPVERPKRSPAHVRAIMAYLKLRSTRHQIGNLLQSINVANRQWLEVTEAAAAAERKADKLDAAIKCRDIALGDVARLRVRCDALERLQLASGTLDRRPADNDQPPPAIILPVRSSSARA